jgi:hypothetical protein
MIELLEVLKWPLVIIIIAFIFRGSITQLIQRVKSVKGVGFGLDTSDVKSKEVQQQKSKDLQLQKLESELNLFNKQTREQFQAAIKKESEWDKVDDFKNKFEVLLRYSEALYIVLFFERIYNLIFGSQIGILKHLNSSNGVPLADVKNIYKDTIQKNNDNLKNYPFESYWGFLESRGLVVIEDKNIAKITWIGRDFLKYLIDNGLNDQKYN